MILIYYYVPTYVVKSLSNCSKFAVRSANSENNYLCLQLIHCTIPIVFILVEFHVLVTNRRLGYGLSFRKTIGYYYRKCV